MPRELITNHEMQWAKWATWLYYPEDGKKVCLRHLKGRTWKGAEREAEKVEAYRQSNLDNGDEGISNHGASESAAEDIANTKT